MAPVTLYTFGPAFGTPDPSPFVMKTMLLLKMAGLPFVEDPNGFGRAPKGKLPYIDDNCTIVADSTLIRFYLERTYGIDFDAGLDPAQRATGWAVERMLEEHLILLITRERWLEDDNFERGPRRFFQRVPAPLRPLVVAMVRRKIRRGLHSQGLGRHDEAEQLALAKGDIDAMAYLIGDKPFLFGDAPHGADATVFGFAAALVFADIQPKLTALAVLHANLRAYVERVLAQYFPGFHAA